MFISFKLNRRRLFVKSVLIPEVHCNNEVLPCTMVDFVIFGKLILEFGNKSYF